MKKDKFFLKRIGTELLSELEHLSRLMDEYDDFICKYSDHIDMYLLRVKASFMTVVCQRVRHGIKGFFIQ